MWYIVWTDKFMSGWGAAKRKSNRCFFGPIETAAVAREIVRLIKGTRDDWIRFDYVQKPPSDTSSTITSYVDLRGWLARVAPKRAKALRPQLFMCPHPRQAKWHRRGLKRKPKRGIAGTKLSAQDEANLFRAFLKMKERTKVRNIQVRRRRYETKSGGLYYYEGRSAVWDMQKRDGGWFVASCSYLTDEGF